MKKISEHLGAIITTIVAIAACIAVVVAVGAGPTTVFFGEIVDKETDIAQEIMDNMETPNISLDDNLPSLQEISTTVLAQASYELYGTIKTRATINPYFYIPVESGKTISIINNDEKFRTAVWTLNSDFNRDFDTGWIASENSYELSLDEDDSYLSLSFSTANGQGNINIEDIDLSNFIITYTDGEENLLNYLRSTVKNYNNATLKNFDVEKISNFFENKPIVAHAGGSLDNSTKNTMELIKNSVETNNFKAIEVDVQVSSDGIFILYHNLNISGMTNSIINSTYEELIAANSDLATLEEALEYCSDNNIKIYLDVKNNSLTEENISSLCSLIEKYNMKDNFQFQQMSASNLSYLPEDYKSIPHAKVETWNISDLTSARDVYSSLSIHRPRSNAILIDNLKQGCKFFSIWDELGDISTQSYKLDLLMAYSYLFYNYNADYYMVFANNIIETPEITQERILKSIPKDLWDKTGLVVYN